MTWFILKDNSIILISHQHDILYLYVIKFLGAYASILSLNKEKSNSVKWCSSVHGVQV